MDAEAAQALRSLIGKGSVRAVSPDGDEISCKVQEVAGDTVRVLLPRLKMAGIDKLILRFAVDGAPWKVSCDLTEAEYHSFDEALGVLAVTDAERDGTGRAAPRVPVHSAGTMKAIHCQYAVDGNEYTVRVDDISETGIQFSADLRVEPGDRFSVSAPVGGAGIVVEGQAVTVKQGAYGRCSVGARITDISHGDLLALRRLASQAEVSDSARE
jgi:hypothetical protein